MPRAADHALRKVIAKNLRDALKRHSIGVVTAAERLEMSPSQLSQYLREHKGFSIETVVRLATGLGCTTDELLYDIPRDLLRHTEDQSSDLPGGADEDSSGDRASLRRETAILRTRITQYETQLHKVHNAARALVQLAAVRRKGASSARRRA